MTKLPSDVQRLLPYVAVAVLAVVGLFLVMRGVGNGGDGPAVPDNPPAAQPAKTTPQGAPSGGSEPKGSEAKQTAPKRSAEAYVKCVEQATDTAGLERCQAFLPRR